MAKKPKGSEPPGRPEVTPQQGIDLLQRQVANGERLLSRRPIPKDDYGSWELVTRNHLEKAFGKNSPNVTSLTSVGKYGAFPMNAGDAWWDNHSAESLQTQLTKLRGLIELLKTEVELRDEGIVKPGSSLTGHRIFLVHGHAELALQETAHFLERLEQDVIILREQPNRGRTLIEKFEDYALEWRSSTLCLLLCFGFSYLAGLSICGPSSMRPNSFPKTDHKKPSPWRKIQFDIYAAIIRWDGTPRNILVEAADTDSLVGMALLAGYDVHIQGVSAH